MRADRRRLERLYRRIPTFDCIAGCTDCCGPVPASASELERAPRLAGVATAAGLCMTCPYSVAGNCAVYADRPFICRLFGAADHPRLRCPHGRGPKRPLTAEQAHALTQEYLAIMAAESAAATSAGLAPRIEALEVL